MFVKHTTCCFRPIEFAYYLQEVLVKSNIIPRGIQVLDWTNLETTRLLPTGDPEFLRCTVLETSYACRMDHRLGMATL